MASQPDFMSINKATAGMSAPSLMKFSTDSKLQSLAIQSKRRSLRPSRSQLPRKGREDLVPGLVRDITKRAHAANLTESDITILETEQICSQLEEACQAAQDETSMQDDRSPA